MVENKKIADEYENAMKKGFISMLVLLVLEKNPSYGYKISKEINKRTMGIWDPPSSTMYTILKDLTKKGLIEIYEIKEDMQTRIRTRKLYRITQKGKESLALILKKQRCIEDSIETLRMTLLNNKEPKLRFGHGPFRFFFQQLNEKSDEERLEFLEIQQVKVESKIQQLSEDLVKIKEAIKKIKEKK
ncbi:MAG: PadR family transcriptional regulator [Candidatus Lokiarchaeota archaeon]|nr:PadR family transcriptional regulator [Candidatus Lokiarchaeota archaeon]